MTAITNKKPMPIQLSILRVGNTLWSFPQIQIAHIALISDMDRDEANNSSLGKVNYDNKLWPIYAIDENSTLTYVMPSNGRYCICFHADQEENLYGLIVDSIEQYVLEDVDYIHPIPECMYNPSFPKLRYFGHRQQISLVATAKDMYQYLLTSR